MTGDRPLGKPVFTGCQERLLSVAAIEGMAHDDGILGWDQADLAADGVSRG
jgi:hypothetical protein